MVPMPPEASKQTLSRFSMALTALTYGGSRLRVPRVVQYNILSFTQSKLPQKGIVGFYTSSNCLTLNM